MAKKVIDPAPIIKELADRCLGAKGIECSILGDLIDMLRAAPAVAAVEVVHGRWKVARDSEISKDVWCTACGEGFYIRKKIGAVLIDKMPYCPNCGAKMDGDGNA